MSLEYTPLQEIPSAVSRLRDSFHTRQLDLLEMRETLLKSLHQGVLEYTDIFKEALYEDFHRAPFETATQEINPVLAEIQYTLKNLKKWSKPEKGFGSPFLVFLPVSQYVEKIPLGTVLIISAFNYPILLSLSPVIGALAAGNCVVLKPSEITPRFSAALTKMLTERIPSAFLRVINGGVPETTVLLQQRFDKILYTGSGRVGKIVSIAAAKQLTPVVLELGGKSPAFLSKSLSSSNLKTAVKRILWGKFGNAGQVCTAVDYLLVERSLHQKVVELVKETAAVLFSDEQNFTHIANEANFKRLVGLLSSTKGNLLLGGVTDDQERYISPTVFDNVQWDDALMQDEIFGPILPILVYDTVTEVVDKITSTHDTPLAAYIYSNDDREISYFKQRVRSGSFFINDGVMHSINFNAPFGGVGTSGQGSYHGKYSYKTFSHERLVSKQRWFTEPLLDARYPPYTKAKEKNLTFLFLPFGKSAVAIQRIQYGALLAVLCTIVAIGLGIGLR